MTHAKKLYSNFDDLNRHCNDRGNDFSTTILHSIDTRYYNTDETMDIYVDIGGLLANEEKLAIGAAEFIKFCNFAL